MEKDSKRNKEKVEVLLKSDFLTEPTRRVLSERLGKVGENVYLDKYSFKTLSRICDLLVAQDSDNKIINIAHFIDDRLSKNKSDGWRYDQMPDDRTSYNLALKGINEDSFMCYESKFLDLTNHQQISLLKSIQKGEVKGESWDKINSKLFFEDLLAETTEIFFSHPEVQMSINYVGMADAKGWTRLKLNQNENLEN